jgi:hypothetical protein
VTDHARVTKEQCDVNFLRSGRAGKAKSRGGSLVEFAIIGTLFFVLIFAVIDIAVLEWVTLTMQHAVREGARYAVTGRIDLDPSCDPSDPGCVLQRYLAVIEKIKQESMGLYDRVDPVYIINGVQQDPPFSPGMFGGPGDITTLQLRCTWPLMTPVVQPFFTDGEYTFVVGATMRNEVF